MHNIIYCSQKLSSHCKCLFFPFQVKAAEVVQCFIDRILSVNKQLNAVVAEQYTAAISLAESIDSVLESEEIPEQYSQEKAPFLGVPFTAKEAFGVIGKLAI